MATHMLESRPSVHSRLLQAPDKKWKSLHWKLKDERPKVLANARAPPKKHDGKLSSSGFIPCRIQAYWLEPLTSGDGLPSSVCNLHVNHPDSPTTVIH